MNVSAFDVVLIVLILAAAFFAMRHILKTGKSGGCGCGCDKCGSACQAEKPGEKENKAR